MSRGFSIALLLLGCEAPTEMLGVGPPELELYYRGQDPEWQPLIDGGMIPLLLGPAGGFFSQITVDVRNLSASELAVEVSLLHPSREEPQFILRRQMSAGDPIAVLICPSPDRIEIPGSAFTLSVAASDASGRRASATRSVVPSCVEPERADLCRCWCSASYPDCGR